MRFFLGGSVRFAAAILWFAVASLMAADAPLNVVLILADDLGAHDLGITGSRFHETPNLDRLAREGVRFTQAYSACTVCSPTRAALMTGKSPARLKITDWIAGHDRPQARLRPPADWQKELPLAETTLAERAKAEGYATVHLGKWHLGGEGFWPAEQGFDLNLGGYFRGQPPSYFVPYGLPQLADGPPGEYLTDREGEEAARFIAERSGQPFFLNYWPYAVHTPLQAKTNLIEKYRRKAATVSGAQTNATYAAMLESLDAAVGRILQAISDAGIAERTVVIFTSDNGGLTSNHPPATSNAPLRSGKGSPYEGGVRVPLIVKWPGMTRAGTECAEPVITMDVAATVAAALGVLDSAEIPDGRSLVPLLHDPQATLGRESLCWHYPHYHPGGSTPYAAIRAGDWKLIQYYEDGRHELFNLNDDPSEATNLAGQQPDRVQDLARKLFNWQGSVGAQWPMYNPNHEPPPVAQSADGSVLLHSREAAIHGTTLRYEPQPFKNTLGWWGRVEDWVDWTFTLTQPGTFEVEVLQGCGRGQGGSDVTVEVGETTLPFVVQETGHFQIFVPRRVGRVTLPVGTHTLALKPQRKQAGAVMDVRQVKLIPVASTPAAKSLLEARRIVVLGDSITYAGEWVELVEAYVRMKFPEARPDFINLGLPSETVSGLSEDGHAGGAFPRPDLHERLERVLEQTQPDLIVACYGMNDGIYLPFDPERFQKFQKGIQRLRERSSAVGAPVIHLTPPTFDEVKGGHPGYGAALDRYSEWLVSQRAQGWDVIDTHTPMNHFLGGQRRVDPQFALAGDGVHVNTQGHWLIAREVLRQMGAAEDLTAAETPEVLVNSHPRGDEILKRIQQRQRLLKDAWLTQVGHLRPGMAKGKPLPEAEREAKEIESQLQKRANVALPGIRSLWFGFDRYDFEVGGKPVLVVAPKMEAPGRPWVWHGEFFGHKPNPDLALLGRGFHIVYLSVPDLLGSPEAVRHWDTLYRELTEKYAFAAKPALVGLSRGGLYCYNWAAAHPDQVACLYGDAPVCDFRSWPGGFGKGQRSDRDWQWVRERYGFQSDDEAKLYARNPVDNLAPLAAAKVPLLHVFGDADEVVPWDENTGIVAERYQKLGGDITLIRKPGVKHHPHGLDDSTPIVEFIWKHTANDAAQRWLSRHGGGPLDAEGRPLIRRFGTIDLDLVETTPVVVEGKPWRFEWVRQGLGQQYWDNQRATNYFRFRDPATGEVTPPFADGHEFGSAFVHDGTVYVTGTQGRSQINVFASRDLKNWESWTAIPAGRYGIFNTSLCRAGNEFVLMFEIDKPAEETGVAFTARFAQSPDLRTWTLTPPECNYAKDRYTAPHCLRWLDGWFYNFYLEAHQGYEMRVVRSRDLVNWEASPLNPVLRHSPDDKVVANPQLTDSQRQRLADARNLNNSDIDFCEWQGRLMINYSWGNQLGIEHLAEAVYDGTEAQFLRGWFPAR